jgi:hypothetical protein
MATLIVFVAMHAPCMHNVLGQATERRDRGLNRSSKLPSDDPQSKAINNKRRYELPVLPKEIVGLARHYEVEGIVIERLSRGPRDHGKDRTFNRRVNQCWFRAGAP